MFKADGKSSRTIYQVYKILSEQGVQDWDSVEVDWEPWHEEKPMVRARVITPDHVAHLLSEKSITDSPAKDSGEKEYGDRALPR